MRLTGEKEMKNQYRVITSYKCNTGINRRTKVFDIEAESREEAERLAILFTKDYTGTCGLVWFIRDVQIESVERR